jgi:hypothetical protein
MANSLRGLWNESMLLINKYLYDGMARMREEDEGDNPRNRDV